MKIYETAHPQHSLLVGVVGGVYRSRDDNSCSFRRERVWFRPDLGAAFLTIACVVLQEASARITLASGSNLGEVVKKRFRKTVAGRSVTYLVLTAILLGCAAYEAGHILGGVAGTALVLDPSMSILSLFIGLTAGLLLRFGSIRQVAQLLGVIVAVMGLCFLTTAIVIAPNLWELLSIGITPSIPSGSELLVIGLIGTTVVPYNLFLGVGAKAYANHERDALEPFTGYYSRQSHIHRGAYRWQLNMRFVYL